MAFAAPLLPLLLFDAHCHLADARLAHCADALLQAARSEHGVRHCVVNGTCERDWPAVAALAARHPSVVLPSFGLHPWRVHECTADWQDVLEAALTAHPGAALGEAGLHAGGGATASATQQAAALEAQLALATRLRRPISLHCVQAFEPMHAALLAAAPPSGYRDSGLLLHGYSGSAEMVRRFVALGAHFSFSATLGSMAARRAAALLAAVPDDRILLETDAPDGLPRRGSAPLPLPLLHAPPAASALAFGTLPCGCDDEAAANGCEQQQRPLNHPVRGTTLGGR
jgi:TatD DNase family protein